MELNLESLGYNPKSKFAVGMVDLFRELKTFPLEQPETSDFNKLFFDTVTFFENTTVPKIKKVFSEALGITIDRVYCRELYAPRRPNTTGTFALIVKNYGPGKDLNWLRDVNDVVSGGANKQAHIGAETAKQLNDMMANFDGTVGRFRPAKHLQNAVTCDLVIDLAMVVFVDKITHEKLVPLTCEEAAAVMTHEAGHVCGTISYLKYANHSIEVLRGAFEHFKTYASPEEKYIFVNDHIAKKTGLWGKDKTTAGLAKLLDQVAAELPNIPKMETSTGTTTLFLFNQIIDMLLRILFLVFYMPLILFFQMMSFRISEIAFYDTRDGMPKTTDYKAIKRQRYEVERIADEFVVTQNLGSYLQSALMKISSVMVYNLGKDTAFLSPNDSSKYSNSSRILFHFNNFIGGTKYIFNNTVFGAFGSYPEMHDRIGNIARMQLKMVRSSIHNPALLELALEEYDKTYMASKNVAALDVFRKGVDGLVVVLQNLFSILSFGLMNANQRRHVEQLLSDAEKIMNTDLYASTAKIQLLYMKSA